MGRSIRERPIPPSVSYYHRRSNRQYKVEGTAMRRHQTGPSGAELNVVEEPVDLAIGSGNHAITYVSRTPQGRLLELPLTWYARGKIWAMSPGYDRADHEDFRREISDSCLFCHSNGPKPAPIDCGRCHGSPDAHLKTPGRGNIVNPAKLDSKRQLEVCLQCHLQTTSSGIPDSVRQPGRSAWSFQPGMALGDYKMLFDRQDQGDHIEINHAGYRLLQSSCFRSSQGKMQCTTCHDPHTAKVRANACAQCHTTAHAGERAVQSRGSCESCHMPKRAPSDAIHTVITDHKIVRRPSFVDPKEEDHRPYRGAVIPFYTEADPLSIAAANAPGSDPPRLYRALADRDPENVPLLTAFGKVLLRAGRPEEAVPVLERALRLDPMYTDARAHLAVADAVQGRHREALQELERAVRDNPDHALSWINLGITRQAMGDTEGALRAYTEAIRIQPDSSEARRRRAELPRRP